MFPWLQRCGSRLLRVKKRRLLLLLGLLGIIAVIGVVVSIPLLVIGMMMTSRLLMILAGPVNIWNTTWHTPSVTELAGYYRVLPKDRADYLPQGAVVSERSGFRLGTDHRVEVTDLPDFDGFGSQSDCSYNGTGRWSSSEGLGVTLNLDIQVSTPGSTGSRPSCGPSSLSLFQLLGHSPPYRIWYNIGDPDEGHGLTYVRQGR